MFRSISTKEKISNFYNTGYHYGDSPSKVYSRMEKSIPVDKVAQIIVKHRVSHIIDLGCGTYIERLAPHLRSISIDGIKSPKYDYTPSYTGVDINKLITDRCINFVQSYNGLSNQISFMYADILMVKYDKLIQDIRSKSHQKNGNVSQRILIIASDIFGFNTVTDNIALFERLAKIKHDDILFLFDNYSTSRQNGIDFNIIDGYMHNLLSAPFDLDLCGPCIYHGVIKVMDNLRGIRSPHEYIMHHLDTIKNAFEHDHDGALIIPEKKKKKILFLAWQDFANVCADLSWSINKESEMYESKLVCKIPHPFQYKHKHDLDLNLVSYPNQTTLTEEQYQKIEKKISIVSWARNVDIIYFSDEMQDILNAYEQENSSSSSSSSCRPQDVFRMYLMGWTHLRKSVKWISWHAGCSFRSLYEKHNAIDQKRLAVTKQIVNHDLFHLALSNVSIPKFGMCISYSFAEEERLLKKLNTNLQLGSIKVTHSPSDYSLKGTLFIRKAIEVLKRDIPGLEYIELGGPINTSLNMNHEELIHNRYQFDFYIDQFNPMIGGIGISSFEAIRDGLITFCTYDNLSEDTFIKCGFSKEAFTNMPVIPLSLTKVENDVLGEYMSTKSKTYRDNIQSLPTNDVQLNTVMVKHLVNSMMPYFRLSKNEIIGLALDNHRWIKKYFDPRNIIRIFEESIQ